MWIDLGFKCYPTTTARIVAANDQSHIKRAMIPYKTELHPVFKKSAPFASN